MAAGPPKGHRVWAFDRVETLMRGAARVWLDGLSHRTERPRVVLAGGSTPRALYRLLSGELSREWNPEQVRFTFSDERCVPPAHKDSNYAMAGDALFAQRDRARVDILRLRGEDPPERGAEKAHRVLAATWAQRTPLFDTVLLGLGEDAHVASLFPAETWPDFSDRWAAPVRHPDGQWRITLTPAALRSTRCTIFLVAGAGKAEAVRRSLTEAEASPRVPARLVVGGGEALWMLDAEAASLVPENWLEPELRDMSQVHSGNRYG